MTAVQSVCVYCGSQAGAADSHREAARRLGAILAENGVRMIYGGGHVGLMGLAADAALAGGGEVVGVIPKFLVDAEVAYDKVSELVTVGSMHERKQRMFELADAFAVLPGGLGTLDETIEIVTWKQLRLHDKPIVIVDVDGYWRPLWKLVEHVVAEGYAPDEVGGLYTVVESVEEVLPRLAAIPETAIRARPRRL